MPPPQGVILGHDYHERLHRPVYRRNELHELVALLGLDQLLGVDGDLLVRSAGGVIGLDL